MTSNNATTSHSLPPDSFGLPIIGETLSFLFDRDFADKVALKVRIDCGDCYIFERHSVSAEEKPSRFICWAHFFRSIVDAP